MSNKKQTLQDGASNIPISSENAEKLFYDKQAYLIREMRMRKFRILAEAIKPMVSNFYFISKTYGGNNE